MSNDQNKILNHLVDVCEDARDFYSDAAEQAENPQIQNTFRKIAAIRENIISDLKSYIVANGGSPEQDGTMGGKASKMFSQLKASVANTDETLVKDLEEAEDKSLEEFHEAIAKNLPENTREFLTEQTKRLRDTHDHMKHIKDCMKKAA